MVKRSPSATFGRRGRRALAGGLAAAVVAGLSVLAPVTTASAAPQADSISLATIGAAPQAGTLANQVGWSVNVGTWNTAGQGYAITNPQSPQIWQFDRPVSVGFGIAGLNLAGECVVVPEGTLVVAIHANHAWDEAARRVCHQASGPADESTFSHPGPLSQLVLANVGGASNAGRGITFLEVTYDVPVSSVQGPDDGAEIELGDEVPLDFSCADGTGEVTGSATVDGAPIDHGASVGELGSGTYELVVTCTDEHGATHSTTTTFTVVDETPPVVTVTGPEDGATYVVGDEVPAAYTCEDLGLVSCTAVGQDGNPVNPGDPVGTGTPGTYAVTVTGVDESGNETTVTVTYTVVPPPCAEDGLQVLDPPHRVYDLSPLGTVYVGSDPTAASELVHRGVEPLTAAVVDPVTLLLGLPVTPLVHAVNCGIVVPVEDLVDAIAIPVVVQAKSVLRGVLGLLR